jgi:hypothetical protein
VPPIRLYNFCRETFIFLTCISGHAVRHWLRHCATRQKVSVSIPHGVIGNFRPHCGPGVDSASNRNGRQEYFLRGKAGGAEG